MKPTPGGEVGRLPLLRIGVVAQKTRVSPSTIRWYETLGLLLPQREASGYRLYSEDDVRWILELRAYLNAKGSGPRELARMMRWLPLAEIRAQTLGTPCNIVTPAAICWSGNTDAVRSRICRACPSYAEKQRALHFERHFKATPIL